MARQISYSVRDFASLKQEQIDYIKKYYPDSISNFNDGSIMSVLLDLNAAISDNLYHAIDRSLQETVLDFAQERKSLYYIAKTYGLKLPSKAASIAVVQFTVNVPVSGTAEDKRYLPTIQAGTQVIGNNQVFELLYDVDFSSNFNINGALDRTKVPIFNNGKLGGYNITKTGIVVAGTTRIFSHVFDGSTPQPFYKLILPENNVLSIDAVIHKDGTNFQVLPTYDEFYNSANIWYEVNSLAEASVFSVDRTIPPDSNGIYKGQYIQVNNKFVREFSPTGFCTLTFGSQVNQSFDILNDFLNGNPLNLNNILNNNALGYAPFPNTTMYVKYRVGGGADTNIGNGVITDFGTQFIQLNGPDAQTNAIVKGSLTVTNITPAVGGGDAPSIEELRNYISYNFAAQQRAVTLNDYKATLMGMPSQFGTPSRVGVLQNKNKVEINVITTDSDGSFQNIASSALMDNIATYLSEFRMINDYVLVKPGEVIDLGIEISVLVDQGNQVDTVTQTIQTIKNSFNPSKLQMGQSFYIGTLIKAITGTPGILHLNYIKIFNKVGGAYSNNIISQNIVDVTTNEVDITSGLIACKTNQILQLRNPDTDIVIIPIVSTPIRAIS